MLIFFSEAELVGGGLVRSVGDWKELKELRDSGERVRADERILGGSEFVERVLRESDEEWERKHVRLSAIWGCVKLPVLLHPPQWHCYGGRAHGAS